MSISSETWCALDVLQEVLRFINVHEFYWVFSTYCFFKTTYDEHKSKRSSVPLIFPLKNESFDCTSPCSSMLKEVLLFEDKVSSVRSLLECFPWMTSLFMDLCEKPTVCQSAGCLGFAGLASEGGVWGRWQSHLDDDGWWVTWELGSDPPAAAPQLPCLRFQSGLRRTGDTCVSECCCYIIWFRKNPHYFAWFTPITLSPADTSTTAMKRAISSGSSPREPNFSLNSNIASRREPIPKARKVDRG